jgi:hypothetical protein
MIDIFILCVAYDRVETILRRQLLKRLLR